MAASTALADRPTRDSSRRQLVRAAVASAIGTTIVWYDFFLYGFAATLVLGRLFFPSRDPFLSTLLAVGTYAVGFAARPIGAVVLGRLGDRIGRRATLIATLVLIGLATSLIGLVPTQAQIGVLGGILLTLLRIVQGIGMGGQWAPSVLLPVEWGQRGRRGLLGSWPQVGVPAGLVLAYGSLQLFTLRLGQDAGWRIPFLLSIVLVGVALYVRLGIQETPVFSRLLGERLIEEAPVLEVLARQWREVVLTALLRTGQQAPFAIFTLFALTYATGTLGLPQAQVVNLTLIAAGASLVAVPFWGFLSDSFGRRRLVMIGAAAMLAWSYPYWVLLGTRVPALVSLAIVLALPIHDIQHGPQATFIAESFTGRLRCTGASLGYQLASLTADGPAILVAFALLHAFGSSLPIAVYMIVCAAVSLVSAAALRDRSRQDMSVEYDDAPLAAPAPRA
jgi:MFS family permease